MSNRIFLLLFLFFVILSSCKTSQPTRPQEYYQQLSTEAPLSSINIPIRIYKDELLQSINQQLGEVIYADNNMEDDGMAFQAKKREGITLNIDGQFIKYLIPLDLWIKKDVFLSTVEAEGSLALEFQTQYQILEDWTLETKTTVSNYNWIKKPVVKLGFAELPITPIANIILNQAKTQLAGAIDEEVKAAFDLKASMQNAWKEMNEPYLLSPEYQAWLRLQPQSMEMTPLTAVGNTIQSTVTVFSRPLISIGEKPKTEKPGYLPDFKQSAGVPDNFNLFLDTSIPFGEAQRISKQNMQGEVFSYGNKQVTVEDVELFGQGNKLVVNTKLKGSYNGNVYLIAQPKFNDKRNKIELADVDFDFSTQKSLLKSASWLFKGSLKKKVQENLNFYLDYNLKETEETIRKELENYPLAPGINLRGALDQLSVSHVYVAADAIRVQIGLSGNLNLEIKGIGK